MLYPDELSTTEAVLRAYPDALREKAGFGVVDDVHVDGGSGVSAGDRYTMAADQDAWLCRARRIVAAVRAGMAKLNNNENRVARAVYFESLSPSASAAKLNLSVSYVRALVESARAKLVPYCINVYPDVYVLRETLYKERLDVLRKQEESFNSRVP